MFGGTVVSGGAAMSYVDQMLQKSFTLGSFHGGSLLLRAIEPFRAGDTSDGILRHARCSVTPRDSLRQVRIYITNCESKNAAFWNKNIF